jgi:hypothetical protein
MSNYIISIDKNGKIVHLKEKTDIVDFADIFATEIMNKFKNVADDPFSRESFSSKLLPDYESLFENDSEKLLSSEEFLEGSLNLGSNISYHDSILTKNKEDNNQIIHREKSNLMKSNKNNYELNVKPFFFKYNFIFNFKM